jgi:hypothetical protein
MGTRGPTVARRGGILITRPELETCARRKRRLSNRQHHGSPTYRQLRAATRLKSRECAVEATFEAARDAVTRIALERLLLVVTAQAVKQREKNHAYTGRDDRIEQQPNREELRWQVQEHPLRDYEDALVEVKEEEH